MERQKIILILISFLFLSCNPKREKEINVNSLDDSFQIICLKDRMITSTYNEVNNIHSLNIYNSNLVLIDKMVFYQEPLPRFSIDGKNKIINITYINLSKTKTLDNTLNYYLNKKKSIDNYNINYIINNNIEGEYLKSKEIFNRFKINKNNYDIDFFNKVKKIKTINLKELIFSENQDGKVLEYSSGIINKINNINILIPVNDTIIKDLKKEILSTFIKK